MITKTLGDFEHYVNDGNYGNIYPKSSEFLSEGIPFVSASDFDGRIFNLNGIKHISLDMHNNLLTKGHIKKNDILFVVRGNGIGKVGIFKEDIPECNINAQLAFYRIQNNCINPDYLYYLLSSKCYFKVIQNFSTGSAQPQLPINRLLQIPIKYDENVEHQKKIVNILSTLDKKIELNNKIISELEGISKTLYNYWFLQFEFPNAEGKPYKSSGGKMVYNEQLKREIPEGWEVKEILELVDWVSNSQPPKSQFCYEPKDGYIRFIQNRDYDSDSYKTYIPYKKSLSVVNRFDILMDKYGDAGAIRYGIEGVFNVALGKIEVKYKNHLEYIRSFLGSSNIYTYLHNSCMASTRASLSEENLKFLYLPIPNDALLEKYEKMMHNIRENILKNKDENQELTSLRDFLLPLLMNGQVTFKEDNVETLNLNNRKSKTFNEWKQVQCYAARGDMNDNILKKIYDAMDDDDKM